MCAWKCHSVPATSAAFGLHQHDALQVLGQAQHGLRVGHMVQRRRQRRQADDQLHPQDDEDRDVGAVAGQADARVEQAAVQQHGQPDEAQATGHTAGHHRDQLLLRGRDEDLVQPVRRELAEQVAEEQEQDAAVEQVAAPAQLRLAQQLRAVALPGVLVAVEAGQAAHEEHGEADVRIDVEDEVVEGVHVDAPGVRGVARAV
jgi:hypothetical protein